jgi:hypothetical protein
VSPGAFLQRHTSQECLKPRANFVRDDGQERVFGLNGGVAALARFLLEDRFG